HKASMEPAEFADFVLQIRNLGQALGTGKKKPFQSERQIALVARKSVVTLKSVKKGERFTIQNLGIKRPGTGLPPKYFDVITGAKAVRNIPADTLIKKNDYAA
ncbi:MAG: SAF domain-containing protein, partial [bacterium]|nr:SAF domain-containing protein [bacterium]